MAGPQPAWDRLTDDFAIPADLICLISRRGPGDPNACIHTIPQESLKAVVQDSLLTSSFDSCLTGDFSN
jgi:hypothetical protein